MTAAHEIPLFPLNAVLFPWGPLQLRIFETRYVDMVRRCMREGTGFGVVLISEGVEAGGPATTVDIGTYARIVDFSQYDDGLLGIRALGERRFRILERRRARDGLNLADIEFLPAETGGRLPQEFAHFGQAIEQAPELFREIYAGIALQTDDTAWVGARLAELMPLSLAQRQHCLELDDGIERLRYLQPMLENRPPR